MATYFNDCSSVTGWSERIKTGRGWASSGGSIEIIAAGTTDWNYLTLDEVEDSNHANVEILAKYTTPSSLSNARYPLVVRGAGSDESATGYSVRISSSAIRIYACDAADAPVQVATASFTFSTSTTYWIRFRANSTSLKVRVWADGGGEPGTWGIDVTDGTISAAGWNGLSDYSTNTNGGTVDQIGFGTNGDTAPSSAGGGGATGTGSPAAQSATVSGTATRTVTGSGTPTAQAATASGTAEREVTASGTVAAQSATVAGTAEREITSSGTPTAQSATVVGTGQVGNVVTGSGTPTAQSATVSGTAEREITASGTISASAATVVGTAERTITATGTLAASSATVYGFDSAPVSGNPTSGGGTGKVYSSKKLRREVDEWLEKQQEAERQKILARIQREDEELMVIMLALAA